MRSRALPQTGSRKGQGCSKPWDVSCALPPGFFVQFGMDPPSAEKIAALKEMFSKRFGFSGVEAAAMRGDGSSRRLYRLAGASRAAVGVIGPDALENRAFLAFSRHFRKEGLNVPEIYAEDQEKGLYLEE